MGIFFVACNNAHNIILPHFNIVYSSLCCIAPNCDTIRIANGYIQHYDTTYLAYAGLHNNAVDTTLKSTWLSAKKACLYWRTKSICCQNAIRGNLQIRFFRFCFDKDMSKYLRLLIGKDVC